MQILSSWLSSGVTSFLPLTCGRGLKDPLNLPVCLTCSCVTPYLLRGVTSKGNSCLYLHTISMYMIYTVSKHVLRSRSTMCKCVNRGTIDRDDKLSYSILFDCFEASCYLTSQCRTSRWFRDGGDLQVCPTLVGVYMCTRTHSTKAAMLGRHLAP